MAFYSFRVTGSGGTGTETAHSITVEDDRAPEVLAQVLVENGFLNVTRVRIRRGEVVARNDLFLFRGHIIHMTPEEEGLQNAD